MQASLILRELRILVEELLQYGRLLEMDLSDPKIDISEEVYEQIRKLHEDEITKTKVFELAMANRAFNLGAYQFGDNYKMLAKIKWFRNEATGGDYGFIDAPGLGDVFFHFEEVIDAKRDDLISNKWIIAELSKDDFGIKEKKSAHKVTLPKNEKDVGFILNCFTLIFSSSSAYCKGEKKELETVFEQFQLNLENNKDCITDKDRNYFVELISQLLSQQMSYSINNHFGRLFSLLKKNDFKPQDYQSVTEVSRNFILQKKYDFETFNFILNFRHFCGIPTERELEDYIIKVSPESDLFYWWNTHNLNVPKQDMIESISREIMQSPPPQVEILNILSIEDVEKVLDHSFQIFVNDQENKYSLETIGDFFKLSSPFKKDFNLDLLGAERLFNLWLKGLIDFFPLKLVKEKIFKRNSNIVKGAALIGNDGINLKLIFNKISQQEINDLVASYYFDGQVNEDEDFKDLITILQHNPNEGLNEKLKNDIFNHLSDFFKLQFYIRDFTDDIDFNATVIYTGLLNSSEQKLLFKKLIKSIEERKLELTLEDLNRITTIDYQTNEYAKEIDGVGLDYTLSVILQLLNDLKNGTETKSQTIFDIIAKQIKRPDDLLVIDGFFDKCKGRTVLKKNTNAENPETEINEKWAPRFSTFCDGRKAIDKSQGEPSKCQNSGLEFWWCENAKCYDIARISHNYDDWKNYNLEDIFRVLEISYSQKQYQILLSMLNRVNRFLSHLTCKSCKKILKPVNQGNYGFYRVSNFQCPDSDCEEHENVIYLSHCANGACQDIIDSRDSVKCKPQGVHDDCGWYICNNCLACCSTEKLRGRQYAYNFSGQEYKCHTEGHKDRGVLCCNKCGEEMEGNEQFGSVYRNQLKWFVDKHLTHKNIIRTGKRNDGKWWFIWEQGGYSFKEYRKHLENLYKTGFNIPDYFDETITSQLIAEPFKETTNSKTFNCKSCNNIYKLNDLSHFDYARQRSIYNYHDIVFPKQRVK